MLFSEENYKFMYAALVEAEKAFEEDEVPVGAVIVKGNRIIAKGYNQVERLKDPTAHAEMIAITSATNHLENKYLEECDIYVTLEPCLMCAGALINSRIKNLYFAAFEPKTGACGTKYNVFSENGIHKINIFSGLYSNESELLLKKFFHNKRRTE